MTKSIFNFFLLDKQIEPGYPFSYMISKILFIIIIFLIIFVIYLMTIKVGIYIKKIKNKK